MILLSPVEIQEFLNNLLFYHTGTLLAMNPAYKDTVHTCITQSTFAFCILPLMAILSFYLSTMP